MIRSTSFTPGAFAALALASLALRPVTAHAQYEDAEAVTVTEEREAEALKLFHDGRALMQQAGKLDAACQTLTQSYELHNRGDTLLNLGECHRRQGKTATAWREFDEAIRYAQAVEFTEAIAAAAKLRDELAKDLSRLIVEVSPEAAAQPTLVVVLDGKKLPKEQWGQQLFVDPGMHDVLATAEGYQPFRGETEVKKQADQARIVVKIDKVPPPPPPKKEPPPPPPKKEPPPPPPPPVAEPGGIPTWSLIVGGAGVVMMGVAVGFGIDTVSVGGELDDQCGDDRQGCPQSYDFDGDYANEQRSFGLFVGLGVAGVGAAAAGLTGVLLGLSDAPAETVGFAPWVSPEGAGLGVSTRW